MSFGVTPCVEALGIVDLLERACRAQPRQEPERKALQLQSVCKLKYKVEVQKGRWASKELICRVQ